MSARQSAKGWFLANGFFKIIGGNRKLIDSWVAPGFLRFFRRRLSALCAIPSKING
jgi:hypothetical protein